MASFVRSTENFASRNALFDRGAGLVVGVSGGPDSTALLSILAQIREKYALKIRVAHLNYGLRGRSSDADERFVRELAFSLGIPCSVKKAPISRKTPNLEAKLREIRYAYFEQIRKRYRMEAVVVAHTADDQAETLLFRLFRGGGMRSLAAMRPKAGHVVRPLLWATRKDVMAYLKQNKFGYRVDKSNTDLKYTRNRIRHRVLPYLVREFGAGLPRLLSGEASVLGQEYAFLESASLKHERSIGLESHGSGSLWFTCRSFLRLPPAVRTTLLRLWTERLSKGAQGLTAPQAEEAINMLVRFKNKPQEARFGRLKILRKGAKVMLIYA